MKPIPELGATIFKRSISNEDSPLRENSDPWRVVIALLLFTCHVANYADRTLMSIGVVYIAEEHGYSMVVQAHILASFYVGYLAAQLPGGVLSGPRSIGPTRTLAIACFVWSTMTLMVPSCAARGLSVLIANRVVVGAAEGVYYPACLSLISRWFPVEERSSVIALGAAGQLIGAVVGMLCSPIAAWSWPFVFYLFGGVGFVWCFFCVLLCSDAPPERRDQDGGGAEDAYGSTNTGHVVDDPASYCAILSHSAFWAACSCHCCCSLLFSIMLSWLPKYVHDTYAVPMSAMGTYAMAPYLGSAIFACVWALYVDRCLRERSWKVGTARLVSVLLCSLGPALVLSLLVVFDGSFSAGGAVMMITLALSTQSAVQSGALANLVDIGGVLNTGRVTASSGLIACTPALFGNELVGYIVETLHAGWPTVFAMIAICELFSCAVFTRYHRAEPVEF